MNFLEKVSRSNILLSINIVMARPINIIGINIKNTLLIAEKLCFIRKGFIIKWPIKPNKIRYKEVIITPILSTIRLNTVVDDISILFSIIKCIILKPPLLTF